MLPDKTGCISHAGANTYKKRRFLPPSNQEEYERQKILKSVSHHMENHEEKIGQFFKKLDIPIQTVCYLVEITGFSEKFLTRVSYEDIFSLELSC